MVCQLSVKQMEYCTVVLALYSTIVRCCELYLSFCYLLTATGSLPTLLLNLRWAVADIYPDVVMWFLCTHPPLSLCTYYMLNISPHCVNTTQVDKVLTVTRNSLLCILDECISSNYACFCFSYDTSWTFHSVVF